MSKVTETRCDRCGATIPDGSPVPLRLVDTTTHHPPSWDLCTRCAGDFQRFLKGERDPGITTR